MNTCKAKIIYNPKRPGLKRTNRDQDWFCVAEVDNSICEYYRHWVTKGTGKILQGLAWKPHVTVVNGKEKVQADFQHLWKKYDGKIITIEYSPVVEAHWKFWVLPITSPELTFLRKELGLDTKKYELHLTIGREF